MIFRYNHHLEKEHTMSAEICEFGTAPQHKKDGYRSLGIVIQGTDKSVCHTFERAGDIRLVRSASIHGTNEHEFFVLIKD